MLASIILGAAALVYSILLTPIVRDLFLYLGLVDKPDNVRKLHTRQVPRVGGIAVFLSYLLAFLTLFLIPGLRTSSLAAFGGSLWLFLSVPVIFTTGLIDDLLGLSPLAKMAGQVVASLLAWLGGIQIHLFHGMPLDRYLSLPVTVIWLMVCINAFNLIDGLDGLAAGAGLFSTLTMIAAALLDHNLPLVFVTVPLAGCLLGFLRYNFNPASVFLGDCGSLTIGFLLGAFGVLWSQKINTFLGLSAPVIAISLPLLDTSLAIARRFLRNHPIFLGDRGHIHHRLLDRGNSPKQTAILLYLVCGGAALLALAQQCLHRQFGALVIFVFCVAVAAGVQYLGYVEFSFARRFFTTGTLFRLIDDQIKLDHLTKSLTTASDERQAFDSICRTCRELGFGEADVVSRSAVDAAWYGQEAQPRILVPLGTEHFVVLGGLKGVRHPLALPQIFDLFANGLPGISGKAKTLTEIHELLPLRQSFGQASEMPMTNQ